MKTADNSMFAVRFAHRNAFGTSQTRKTLYEMAPMKNNMEVRRWQEKS